MTCRAHTTPCCVRLTPREGNTKKYSNTLFGKLIILPLFVRENPETVETLVVYVHLCNINF